MLASVLETTRLNKPGKVDEHLSVILSRREELLVMQNQEQNRLETLDNKFAIKSIKKHNEKITFNYSQRCY